MMFKPRILKRHIPDLPILGAGSCGCPRPSSRPRRATVLAGTIVLFCLRLNYVMLCCCFCLELACTNTRFSMRRWTLRDVQNHQPLSRRLRSKHDSTDPHAHLSLLPPPLARYHNMFTCACGFSMICYALLIKWLLPASLSESFHESQGPRVLHSNILMSAHILRHAWVFSSPSNYMCQGAAQHSSSFNQYYDYYHYYYCVTVKY